MRPQSLLATISIMHPGRVMVSPRASRWAWIALVHAQHAVSVLITHISACWAEAGLVVSRPWRPTTPTSCVTKARQPAVMRDITLGHIAMRHRGFWGGKLSTNTGMPGSFRSRTLDVSPLPEPTLNSRARIKFAWVYFILPCSATGLALIAAADNAAFHGFHYNDALLLFFLGLALIFTPTAIRVLMRDVDRRERLILVLVLGAALYVVKILGSPNAFTFNDEYIHLRNTLDILRTHHLFQLNPLLPTASYYPGLAGVTAGLVSLTGLSIFVSGLLVIGAARLLISACFFLIAERMTGSALGGAAASLVYAANPMFLFFSSTFSYEDLALPLAAFAVWWLSRTRDQKTGDQAGHLTPIVTVVTIVAVTVTHHVSGFALAILLGAWWLAEWLTKQATASRRSAGLMFLITGSATLTWFFVVARPAASYLLGGNILPALQQAGSLVLHHDKGRQLYSGGPRIPEWYMLAGFAAYGILLVALPFGLYRAWNWLRARNIRGGKATYGSRAGGAPIAVAIAIAIVFPFSLVPRFTSVGGAVSSRSAEYVFTGLGCILALFAERGMRRRHGGPRRRSMPPKFSTWCRTLAVAGMVTSVFLGDVTVGTAFSELLREPSHPEGDPWTVQPDVIEASEWARVNLGINRHFAADATDSLALATNGEQDTISGDSVWPIFFADTLNSTVVRAIRTTRVSYLLVDWRMTEGVPPVSPGYYFGPYEPSAREWEPFPSIALRKFASSPCVHLVYASGPVQIFDVARIENGSCVPSAVSTIRGKQGSS